MLLSFTIRQFILFSCVLFSIFSFANANDVCDEHLSRIEIIPFESNTGVDVHYDALKAAGKSAVRCLVERVVDMKPKPDPRSIPGWGDIRTTVGDTAVFMLEEITGVEIIKMLPSKYQRLYKQIGIYAELEYLHDGRNNRRVLRNKLRHWYSRKYLPSLHGAT
jgi:hypothetical protein